MMILFRKWNGLQRMISVMMRRMMRGIVRRGRRTWTLSKEEGRRGKEVGKERRRRTWALIEKEGSGEMEKGKERGIKQERRERGEGESEEDMDTGYGIGKGKTRGGQ